MNEIELQAKLDQAIRDLQRLGEWAKSMGFDPDARPSKMWSEEEIRAWLNKLEVKQQDCVYHGKRVLDEGDRAHALNRLKLARDYGIQIETLKTILGEGDES